MKETSKAQAAFTEYLALGPGRSLAKLCKTLGKPSGYVRQLETWSSLYNWVERAREHDSEVAADQRQQLLAAQKAMNERHALIGTTQQAKALKHIERLIESGNFGALATVQLLKLAVDIERAARGAPTDTIELSGKNGGPIETTGRVAIYLPAKNDPPSQEVYLPTGATGEGTEE